MLNCVPKLAHLLFQRDQLQSCRQQTRCLLRLHRCPKKSHQKVTNKRVHLYFILLTEQKKIELPPNRCIISIYEASQNSTIQKMFSIYSLIGEVLHAWHLTMFGVPQTPNKERGKEYFGVTFNGYLLSPDRSLISYGVINGVNQQIIQMFVKPRSLICLFIYSPISRLLGFHTIPYF